MSAAFQFAPGDWRADIYAALKRQKVVQMAYVPDAGHATLIHAMHADPVMKVTVLTTEEEGVALLAGADLGGERGVLLMQSSGVGNCVNMFSLLDSCRFPFFTLVTMRGEYAEFNPWQNPMGLATQKALELMGITVYRVNSPDEAAELVDAGLASAFDAGNRVAILLSQSLIGRKKWIR